MYKDIIIVFLVAILLVVGFHSCNLEKSSSKIQKDLIEALAEKDNLKKTIDERNREITEVRAIVVTKDRQIEKALKEIERLKNLDAKIVFKTRTKFDTISIVLRDTTIIYNTDTIKSQKFEYFDEWLSMGGVIENDSIVFDSLLVNNKYSIEIGDIRKRVFGKEKVAYITNENPYSQTTQAQTFILIDEKKWYERGVFKFVGGAVAAMVLLSL